MNKHSLFLEYFIFSLLYSSITASKIIPLDLRLSLSTFDLNLYLGATKVLHQFELDLSLDFCWLCLYNLDENQEKTDTPVNIIISNQTTKAELLRTSFTFQDSLVTLPNFPFYFVFERGIPGFDSFPLAFNFQDKRFSIIHALFSNYEIGQLSFGFQYSKQKLYLGGLPEEVINNYKYTGKIKIKNEYITWGSNVNSISIGNAVFKDSFYGYFQANTYPLAAPKDFMLFLKDAIFKDYINNKICFYITNLGEKFFTCECNRIASFPNININFDDFTISLSYQDIIKQAQTQCIFQIRENVINSDMFIFGIVALQKYPTLFNYADESITFFSKNPFVITNLGSRIILCSIISIILFISILILLLIKIKI